MTQEEQNQFDLLREQLNDANRNIKEIRAYLSSALNKSNDEARTYRSLFWFLLTLTMVVTIVHFFRD